MRRNIGNEVVIAFLIVAVIIVALASAVLLSNTQDEADATATQVALANATDTPTPSDTPVPPTATATYTPTEITSTATATSTNTPIPSDTPTNIPPTATLTATNTATPIPPTATVTPTNTATDFPPTATPSTTHTPTTIPPTATPSMTPTEKAVSAAIVEGTKTPTATGTPTEVPPTATATETAIPSNTPTDIPPTATNTVIPSETPTDIPPTATATYTVIPSDTPTDIPPTATATNTLIPTPTALAATSADIPPTSTLIPTPTDLANATATELITESSMVFMGIIPTPPATPTVVPRGEPTRMPSTCSLPDGWTQYRVNTGDTLFAIALATNSTVDELRYINCIEDVDSITTNDVIFIPRSPVRPVATIPATGARQGLARIGCNDPRTQITSPIAVQRLTGTFSVFGTATRSDFLYYKIEIRPDWATVYNFYGDSETPVTNGALGAINSDLFDDGLHWILLTVVDQRAEIPAGATCEIPVIFG